MTTNSSCKLRHSWEGKEALLMIALGQHILQIIPFCFGKIISSNCPEAVKEMIGNWLHKMERTICGGGGGQKIL